jgi:tetratricopeptide (TPR) repeat protein
MKRAALLLILFALAAMPSPSSFAAAAKKSEANELAQKGTEAARAGQWDEAIEDLRKATEMEHKYEPSLIAALLGRAASDASQQQFQKAASDYDEVLKVDKHNTTAIEGRASMAMKLNDMDKALEMYSELIKAGPKEVKYLQYRAYIYEVKGDLKNSLADAEKILKVDKNNADALARKDRIEKRLAQEKADQFPPLPSQSVPQGNP